VCPCKLWTWKGHKLLIWKMKIRFKSMFKFKKMFLYVLKRFCRFKVFKTTVSHFDYTTKWLHIFDWLIYLSTYLHIANVSYYVDTPLEKASCDLDRLSRKFSLSRLVTQPGIFYKRHVMLNLWRHSAYSAKCMSCWTCDVTSLLYVLLIERFKTTN
jgi:hypothetical protein